LVIENEEVEDLVTREVRKVNFPDDPELPTTSDESGYIQKNIRQGL
jgi:hypothetical protein